MHCFGISKLSYFLLIVSRVLVPLSILCFIANLAWYYFKKKMCLDKTSESEAEYGNEMPAKEPCQTLDDTRRSSESMILLSSNEWKKSPSKQQNTSVQTFTTYNIWV